MAGTPASSRAGTGIPETLLDAKGDLIAASAADTAARLAVAANGATLVADSAAATGLAWALKLAAKLTKNATQTYTTGVSAVMDFEAEEFDHGGFADLVADNSRVTVPAGAGGIYAIVAGLIWNTNSVGLRSANLRLNGVTLLAADTRPAQAFTALTLTAVQTLVATDFIEVLASQESTANLTLLGDARNFLALYRVFT